jgi:hypothetical protein
MRSGLAEERFKRIEGVADREPLVGDNPASAQPAYVDPAGELSDARPPAAAVLIARDEARCITRCIASLKGVVDKVVVLDTGSRDARLRWPPAGARGAPPALAG